LDVGNFYLAILHKRLCFEVELVFPFTGTLAGVWLAFLFEEDVRRVEFCYGGIDFFEVFHHGLIYKEQRIILNNLV